MRLRDGLLCSSEIYLSGQRNKGPIMKRVVDFDVAVLSGQITKLSGQESTVLKQLLWFRNARFEDARRNVFICSETMFLFSYQKIQKNLTLADKVTN